MPLRGDTDKGTDFMGCIDPYIIHQQSGLACWSE